MKLCVIKFKRLGVLSGVNRGFSTEIGTFFETDLAKTECTFCGQCINVCPTGALLEKDNTDEAWGLLARKEKPGYGSNCSSCKSWDKRRISIKTRNYIYWSNLLQLLKALGFDYVFDTNFAADLTIMEEANEFVNRLLLKVEIYQ